MATLETEYGVLEMLNRAGGRAHLSEMARLTDLPHSTVTRTLRDLEAEGLVIRSEPLTSTELRPKARRGRPPVYYQITTAGLAHLDYLGFKTQKVLDKWFHRDGSECTTGSGDECDGSCRTARPAATEIARLHEELRRSQMREQTARTRLVHLEQLMMRRHEFQGLMRQMTREAQAHNDRFVTAMTSFADFLDQLTMSTAGVPMATEDIYVAESVFVAENPWDGRTRHGIASSLDKALELLSETFGNVVDPLMVTPSSDKDSIGEDGSPTVWMVHHRSERPRDEGTLWIFRESLVRQRAVSEDLIERFQQEMAERASEGLPPDSDPNTPGDAASV